jgi:hypothetical protein
MFAAELYFIISLYSFPNLQNVQYVCITYTVQFNG